MNEALEALRKRDKRLPNSRLYRLEADALSILGKDDAAVETAIRGLDGATGVNRIELLLFISFIDECRNNLLEALEMAEQANNLSRQSEDPILRLRILVTHIRLLRKIGRKSEQKKLIEEAMALINTSLLRTLGSYPKLLEEVAAELGQNDVAILHAAIERLGTQTKDEAQEEALAVTFSKLTGDGFPAHSELLSSTIGKDWNLEDIFEIVSQTKGAGFGRTVLNQLNNNTNPDILKSLSNFFRAGVDSTMKMKSK